MKKVSTKIVLKDFKGESLKNGEKDLTIGDVVSTVLAGKSSNPTLAWSLGKKFATENEIDLKAEDIVFLKKEVEASEAWFAIVQGQVLEILSE